MEKPQYIIGSSGGLKEALEKVKVVGSTDIPVLLLGETGAGKELIARSIHQFSKRNGKPFIRVNCGAISPDLIDSELFGYERGSFTGAISSRKGWFERADGGTLFLDEIGEMSESVQVRLLRILQDGTFDRIGGEQTVKVDVRIVAATHRNLMEMVSEKLFREDLWYRISGFPIRIPALRNRKDDIPELARHFISQASAKFGVTVPELTEADIEILKAYQWPGNVRELEAVLARAVLISRGLRLDIAKALGGEFTRVSNSTVEVQPTPQQSPAPPKQSSLESVARLHIEKTLRETGGRIDGPFGAAKILEIHPNTLRSRMKRLGIEPRKFKKSS